MRILRAKESWLTGATGQARQPVPGARSLASPRNLIKPATAALHADPSLASPAEPVEAEIGPVAEI
jgi:hypothetical protein